MIYYHIVNLYDSEFEGPEKKLEILLFVSKNVGKTEPDFISISSLSVRSLIFPSLIFPEEYIPMNLNLFSIKASNN